MSYYKNFKIVFNNPLWRLYLRWAYKKCVTYLKKLGYHANFSKPGFSCLLCGVAQEKTADEFIRFAIKRNPEARIWIIDIGEEQIKAVRKLVEEKYQDVNINVQRIDALKLDAVIPAESLDWIETDGFMQYFDSPSLLKLWGVWDKLLKPDGFITIRDFSTTGLAGQIADKFRIWLVKVWLKAQIFRHTKKEFYELFKQCRLRVIEGPTLLPTYKRFSLVRSTEVAAEKLPMVWFDKLATSHAIPQNKEHDTPILFIHGAWGGKYQFAKWMQFAAREGWESYALDLRGHGESRCDNFGNTSMEDYVKDIEKVTNTIGPCYVVGHSLGGLALQMAASRYLSIRKAVFLASAPPAGIFGRFKFKSIVLGYIPEVFLRKPVMIKPNDALWFLFGHSLASQDFDFTITESPRALRDIGLWRVRPGALKCPSLVVAGEEDRAIPVRAERAIAKKYGSDYLQIPNIGHMLMMEEGWEEPIQKILKWLSGSQII